jgi:hypothetical protein
VESVSLKKTDDEAQPIHGVPDIFSLLVVFGPHRSRVESCESRTPEFGHFLFLFGARDSCFFFGSKVDGR